MAKNKIIFSDIDGTLVFHPSDDNIEEIGHKGIYSVVEDKSTRKLHECHNVSRTPYEAYISKDTKDLAHKLQENNCFVYVTAARQSTMESRKNVLNFADYIILENGGLILNSNYEKDIVWDNIISSGRKYLKDVEKQLQTNGWILDNKGRVSATRIRKKDNPHKTQDEFNALYEMPIPEELKKTTTGSYLDIILGKSGKENAVHYLIETLGYDPNTSIGIGDDINDIGFLKVVNDKYVLASSYSKVLDEAIKNNWKISSKGKFDGINEILNDILYRN